MNTQKKPKTRLPGDLIVKLGKHDLSELNERGSVTKFLNDIVIHPRWKYYDARFDNDIAVLILESNVIITASIFPVCLWDGKKDPTETRGVVVGWGRSENANLENKPREIELTVVRNSDCFVKNPAATEVASNNTFCAGRDENSGPCQGDSGSGMFMRRDTRFWFLKGLVSFGFVDTVSNCRTDVDVIFTDVLKYTTWIHQVAITHETTLPKIKNESTYVLKPRTFEKEIFCFFESWTSSRSGDGAFTVNHLKPELCTTLVFLHAELEDDNLKPINAWEHTDENGLKLYKTFNQLKRTYRLRTLLSVGSWNEGAVKYSQLAADPERRKAFAENSAEFLKEYEFDGLHFHWEHPAHRGGAKEDKENFVLLLKDIKDYYKHQDLYLTAFIRVQSDIVSRAYDLNNIAKYVDNIMMMSFDMAAYWDGKVGYPAAIFGEGENTVDSRVNFFVSQGVPAEKIVIGIPFFGRTWVTRNEGNIGDPSESGFKGPFFEEPGFLGYNEQCNMRKVKKFVFSYDTQASQEIGKFRENDLTHVVAYDSPRSIVNKIKYMADKKLAGVWTWFVDSDDFRAECEPETNAFVDFPMAKVARRREKDYPLLRTLNEAMEVFAPRKVVPGVIKPLPPVVQRPQQINSNSGE